MNVLIIPSWYSTKENLTNGSFFREQAQALRENGVNVIVAFVEVRLLSSENINEKVEVFDEDGIKTYRIIQGKIPKSGNIGTAIAFKIGLKKIYKNIIKENLIDIVHLHSCIWGGLGGVFIAKKLGAPFIITEHSSYYGRFKVNFLEKSIIRKSFKSANKVISVSEHLKSYISKYNDSKIEVIPNMVDCNEFFNTNIEEKSENTFTFLTLCYLKKNKGVDILIMAFCNYFKGKDVQLIIAGDGPEKKKLVKLVNDLKIDNQVIFKGALTREAVKVEMNKCDVFALSSKFETFGVVLIEALASGKPIISTRNGGANDIVNKENGLLVDIDNIDEMGKGMYYMYKNYSKYNKDLIRKDCIKKYSKEAIIQKLLSIYSEFNEN